MIICRAADPRETAKESKSPALSADFAMEVRVTGLSDDVDHGRGCVRAVKRRAGASQHLYAVGVHEKEIAYQCAGFPLRRCGISKAKAIDKYRGIHRTHAAGQHAHEAPRPSKLLHTNARKFANGFAHSELRAIADLLGIDDTQRFGLLVDGLCSCRCRYLDLRGHTL